MIKALKTAVSIVIPLVIVFLYMVAAGWIVELSELFVLALCIAIALALWGWCSLMKKWWIRPGKDW